MAACALMAGLAVAACSVEAVQPASVEGTPSVTESQVASTATLPAPTGTPDRSQLPVTPPARDLAPTTPPPVVGEVPPALLDKIIADLEGRLGPGGPAIVVTRAEAVVWNDGSLGCPQPGVLYTQALVNGYRVVLQAGSDSYDYRLAERGFFFLCEVPIHRVP
jgi:hypothetical protein